MKKKWTVRHKPEQENWSCPGEEVGQVPQKGKPNQVMVDDYTEARESSAILVAVSKA